MEFDNDHSFAMPNNYSNMHEGRERDELLDDSQLSNSMSSEAYEIVSVTAVLPQGQRSYGQRIPRQDRKKRRMMAAIAQSASNPN